MELYLKKFIPTGFSGGYRDRFGKSVRTGVFYPHKPTDVPSHEAAIMLKKYPEHYGKWEDLNEKNREKRLNMVENWRNNKKVKTKIGMIPPVVAKKPKIKKKKKTPETPQAEKEPDDEPPPKSKAKKTKDRAPDDEPPPKEGKQDTKK